MIKTLLTIALTMGICSVASAQTISGAGATFPYPLYAKWADQYNKQTGISINYQSIGSGAGIKQIQAQTVTFGASDMPLSQAQLDKDQLIQFPTVIGALVAVYNIDGVTETIKLDSNTLSKIYLGQIKKWNDPAIVELNPTIKFPDAAIIVVYRSDGSGTTYVFTQYLSAVSADWAKGVGSNTSIKFPVGVGGKGNEGVAASVKQLKGSIGYVEYAFVKRNQLQSADLIVNGNVIQPSLESFQAGNGVINNAQAGSWPITSMTYILIHTKPKDPTQAKLALDFFQWAYDNGDQSAIELDYVPLSNSIKNNVKTNVWSKVQTK